MSSRFLLNPRSSIIAVAALALAGCSNGVGAGFSPSNPAAPVAQSTADAHSTVEKRVKAAIRITIPRHTTRHVRGTRYLSPATRSIEISVTPKGSSKVLHFNADLTPASNPNCVAGGSSAICTVTLLLAPGKYDALLATFDGLLAGGNEPGNPPTGNKLSENQSVPLAIIKGKANVIGLTLAGIPSSVALLPAAASTLDGSMATGFTGSRCGDAAAPLTEPVSVLGVDADGNYILGAGAPTPILSSSNSGIVSIASTPSPSAPNLFKLSHPLSFSGQGPVTLTATVDPLAGSGSLPISAQVSVTIAGGTMVCGVVTMFPVTGVGANGGDRIAAGPDGALWFTELANSKIGRITTGGSVSEYTIPTTDSHPRGIVAGPDGAMWFTECQTAYGGQIGRITTDGAITEFPSPHQIAPTSIVVGSDGAMWFTTGGIGQSPASITTGGTYAFNFAVSGAGIDLATGPDGALWFTSGSCCLSVQNNIKRVTKSGSSTTYPFSAPWGGPQGITAGPDGAMWFTEVEPDGGSIGRITTAGTITNYSLLHPCPSVYEPGGVVPDCGLTGIVSGPDGALYFAASLDSTIGRVTTSGIVTNLMPAYAPSYLTVGPDQALWFTSRGFIGRMQ